MSTPTTKEVLEIIKNNTETLAKNHLTFATTVSDFINKQSDFNAEQRVINTKMSGYLENDEKTHEKGIVNRVSDVEAKQIGLEVKSRVFVGVVTVLIFIGTFMDDIIGLFKKS